MGQQLTLHMLCWGSREQAAKEEAQVLELERQLAAATSDEERKRLEVNE